MANFENMNIICIIPARGGSKGIPNKNIIDFCGKPLLAWSILQAKESQYVKEVYVSSNSEEILSVAMEYGARAIPRPDELSTDFATSESALRHAIDEIETQERRVDLVVFLQVTSPLRASEDIDQAILQLLNKESDSLLSATVLDDLCAFKQQGEKLLGITYDPYNRGRRQTRDLFYHDNGSIYIFRPNILRSNNNRLGGKIEVYEMPFWQSIEIDEMTDLDIVRFYFKKHFISYWRRKEFLDMLNNGNIDLIVYDFDGVMTNNRVLVLQDGTEAVFVNRGDGLAIGIIRDLGIPQLILSTETNPVVSARARKLSLEVIDSSKDKKESLTVYCKNKEISLKNVVYLGNDVNDHGVMQIVGLPIAPADGHPKILNSAKMILKSRGGGGVIRELAELLHRYYKKGEINGA
ncbi:cytidylyltransferase domain-containing protein [Thermodesulfobacteriota bacterium]